MKKNILFILLILLIFVGISITCIKYFKQPKKENKIENESITYKSFMRETYTTNNILEETKEDLGYRIELNNNKIFLCTIKVNICDEGEYIKKNNKYIITTNSKRILKSNIEIVDSYDKEYGDIIKVIRNYDDDIGGYSIFYFKKTSE